MPKEKDKVKLDKATVRKHEAREEARTLLISGFGSLLQDDTMKSKNPAAVSMAGFMLNYIGNRRYEDETDRETAEDLVIAINNDEIDLG
jgi:hypothetical protein